MLAMVGDTWCALLGAGCGVRVAGCGVRDTRCELRGECLQWLAESQRDEIIVEIKDVYAKKIPEG